MGTVATLSRIKPEQFETMQQQKKYPAGFESGNVYLDKYWDILGYVLSGSVLGRKNNPLSEIINPKDRFVIAKQEYMTEYLRFSSPEDVRMIAAALENITPGQFRTLFEKRNFNVGLMYDFLLETEFCLPNLLDLFAQLKSFYQSAASEGEFVATVIGA